MSNYRNGEEAPEFEERVVRIDRVQKTTKGARILRWRVVGAVGDLNGRVGLGIGKSRDTREAIRKALDKARQNLIEVSLRGTTLPHTIIGKQGAAKVLLKPASPGTGVIAGGSVRAIVELAGIKDILSKSLGSDNAVNIAKATFNALRSLKSAEAIAEKRGKTVQEILR